MTALIRANRPEVSRQFPILGVTVRTDTSPAWVEVAIASDPNLFYGPSAKAQRTHANFYSSRATGLLPAERGEAVYLLPPAVMARFVGQPKLYYALAVYAQPDFRNPNVVRLHPEAMPYVQISNSFTGGNRSLMDIPNRIGGLTGKGNGYVNGSQAALEWGGDQAAAGEMTAIATPTTPVPITLIPSPSPSATVPAPTASAPITQGRSLGYDDGFGAFPAPLADAVSDAQADSLYGIEEPIPDAALESTPQGLAYSRAMTTAPEYPQASRFAPAASVNYRTSTPPRPISRVVIHITDGGASIAGPISWFQNPNQRDSKGNPIHVSAHYVIGQDGEVVQMVRHDDVAWHAGPANSDSVGIEHVANTRGLNPTEAQYCASAALVRWLCDQYSIPIDRAHIQGHSEADTRTMHSDCPNAVWDWDYFMGMVSSASCYPRSAMAPAAQAYAGTHSYAGYNRGNGSRAQHTNGVVTAQGYRPTQSQPFAYTARRATAFTAELLYDVRLIPQPDKLSCWAASMAILVGYRRRLSLSPEAVAQEVGRSLRTSYTWDMLEAVKDHFGFRDISLPSDATLYPPPEQWHQWLNDYGPLWVTVSGAPSHAIVVHGISGDLTPAGTTLSVLNPWDTNTLFSSDPIDFSPPNNGQAYTQSFESFAADFGRINLPLGNWRVLYLPAAPDQSTGLGQQMGVAQSNGGRHGGYENGHLNRSSQTQTRALSGQLSEVNWSDVQLVPQFTGMSCWAAAAAMVVGWRDRVSIDPAEVARGAGQWQAYTADLNPADRRDLAQAWGLVMESSQCYTVEGLRQLLEANGPLWIGVAVPNGHAIVATGIYGDGTLDGTFVRVKDPWPPSQGSGYELTFRRLMQEYEDRMTIDPSGNVNVQILHANGRRLISTSQSYGRAQTYSRSLVFSPLSVEGVDRMRQEFVTNAASGAAKRNCITITNAGLRQLYGAALQNPDGTAKALDSTIQGTMAKLQSYGLAHAEQVFEFNDASGKLTKGVVRPEQLRSSIESWLLAEAEQNAVSAWYVFGLSLLDGYHSVVLTLSFSGTSDPNTKLFWADQIYSGWDDVTGRLDTRILERTQAWWDPQDPARKPRTRTTVWPLLPG